MHIIQKVPGSEMYTSNEQIAHSTILYSEYFHSNSIQCKQNYKTATHDYHNNLGIPQTTRHQSLETSL